MEKRQEIFRLLLRLCNFIIIPLFFLLSYTFSASILFSGSVMMDVNKAGSLKATLIFFSLPMVLFLGVLPALWVIVIENRSLRYLGLMPELSARFILTLMMQIILLAAAIYFLCKQGNEVSKVLIAVHFLSVAVSEEIMVRGILQSELIRIFRPLFAVIFSAVIFAVIYHSNANIMDNLLFRLPLGLVLGALAYYTKSLYSSIVFHWAYNIFVSVA